MKILVGCERSGVVRDAFRLLGHDAWSCDLEEVAPDGVYPEYHLYGDVRSYFDGYWDMLIAFPPCTRLCNSGVRWLHERDLWDELQEGADLFSACLNADIPKIAVENPVMHKHAKERIEGYFPFTQSIQPWQFGHGETKRTCLWLKNLPPLVPTNIVKGREPKVHYASPSPDRGIERSMLCRGIADAMAEQWGSTE